MSEVRCIMPDGATVNFPFKVTETLGDFLGRLTDRESDEEKRRYKVLIFKRGNDGVTFEYLPQLESNLMLMKKEWDTDRFNETFLKILRMTEVVTMHFNIVFRLTAGVGHSAVKFYVNEHTLVRHLEEDVRAFLKIPPTETRFGILGEYGVNAMRKILPDENVLKLRTAYDVEHLTKPKFFYYGVLPEAEDHRHFGAEKSGWLEICHGGAISTWRRRWAALRGTTLFFYKTENDPEIQLRFDNVEKREVTDLPNARKAISQKFPCRFDLSNDPKPVQLAAEDAATAQSWIQAIQSVGTRHANRTAATAIGSSHGDASAGGKPQKRTLIPIDEAQYRVAAYDPALSGTKGIQVELTVREKLQHLVDTFNEDAVAVLDTRGQEMAAQMKKLTGAFPAFVTHLDERLDELISGTTPPLSTERGPRGRRPDAPPPPVQKPLPPAAATRKRSQLKEELLKARQLLKDSVSAVRPASSLPNHTDGGTELNEIRVLRESLEHFIFACQMCLTLLETDESSEFGDFFVDQQLSTTAPMDSELSNVMSQFANFGINEQLLELQRKAAGTAAPAPAAAAAADPTSLSETLGGSDFGPIVAEDAPAADAMDFNDPEFDSMLQNLTSAVSALDSGGFHAAFGFGTGSSNIGLKGSATMHYCQSCSGPIDPGLELMVDDFAFHDYCFFCTTCACPLVDPATNPGAHNAAHSIRGTIYCHMDFLAACPSCAKCHDPVPPNEAQEVGPSTFHKKCFTCADCGCGFPDGRVFPQADGAILCEKCSYRRVDLLCPVCEKPITDDKAVQVLGSRRHIACLVCSHCKVHIQPDDVRIRKEAVWCINCARRFHG